MAKRGVGEGKAPHMHVLEKSKVQREGSEAKQRSSCIALKETWGCWAPSCPPGSPRRTGPLFFPLPPAPVGKAARGGPLPLGPATRGSCSGNVRREDGLWLPRPGNARGGEEEDQRGEQQPREEGRHLLPILSPGLDGKASPTRDLPTPTALLCRKPNSSPTSGKYCQGLQQRLGACQALSLQVRRPSPLLG